MLQEFIVSSLKEFSEGNTAKYTRLVSELNPNTPPAKLFNWFHLLGLTTRQLNYDVHKTLIDAIFKFDWNAPQVVLEKYVELLLRLMSANAIFTKPVLEA